MIVMLGMVYHLVYHINAKTPINRVLTNCNGLYIYILYVYKGTTQKGLLDQDERDTSEKNWALKLDFEEPKLQFFVTLGVFNKEDLGF